MKWVSNLPTDEVLVRARVALCGWERPADTVYFWAGKLGETFWCIYIERAGTRWLGQAYRLEAS